MSMHATIMHFAICLPDWNSLDSVRRAHSFLEGAALAFFALLVVCEALAHLSDDKKMERRFDKAGIVFFAIAVLAEIAAYPYGQRNDRLSSDMIGSLSEKAKQALADSGTALTNSGTALTKSGEAVTKADAANVVAGKALDKSKAAEDASGRALTVAQKTEEYAAWRTISDEQAKVIKTFVGSSLDGHALIIQANPNEAEIWAFANRIAVSFGTMHSTATVWPQGWIVAPGLKFDIGKNRQNDFNKIAGALDAAGVVKAEVLEKASDHNNVTDDQLVLTVGPRH